MTGTNAELQKLCGGAEELLSPVPPYPFAIEHVRRICPHRIMITVNMQKVNDLVYQLNKMNRINRIKC